MNECSRGNLVERSAFPEAVGNPGNSLVDHIKN